MAHAHPATLLWHVRRLAASEPAGARTDYELLERFAASRDEGAFAALVRRHGPMVLSTCRRVLRHLQDAEDAFQATFLILARKAASIRRSESVGAWLHRVAYHLALRSRAGADRRPRAETRKDLTGSADPPAEATWREVQALVDEELQGLPEKYRSARVLCYLEGLTHEAAARRLGWSKGTLRRRLGQGRELLRRRLIRSASAVR
jgi:RNA polymerase sigma factor (sigma-70 family)